MDIESATSMTTENEQEFKLRDAASYDDVTAQFDRLTDKYSAYVINALMDAAGAGPAAEIVDIGCGTGIVTMAAAHLFAGANVTGVDLSDGMLALAAKKAQSESRIKFVKCDAEQLDLPDASVDIAFSLYAFRHLPNPEKAAREIYRILKPGGRIVVAVGSGRPLFSIAAGANVIALLRSKINKAIGRELTACDHIDSLVRTYLPAMTTQETAGWQESHHAFTGSINKLIKMSGFEEIASDWVGREHLVPSIEDFWDLQVTFSSLARKRFALANDAQIADLKQRFWGECASVLSRSGRLVYPVGAAIVAARKNSSGAKF